MGSTALGRNVFVGAAALFLFAAPFTASVAIRNVGAAVAALAAMFLIARGEISIPRPLPRALFAALLAWCLLAAASLAWSANAAMTANELRSQVLYVAIVFAVFYCGSELARWKPWWLTLLAGTLVAFVAESTRQVFSPALGLRVWDGGVGAFSTHLVIVAPLVLAIAWPAPWGAARGPAALAVALALLFAAAWDSGNRIVWVAFLCAFAVALLARHRSVPAAIVRNGSLRVTAIAMAMMVLLFSATAWQRDGLFARDEARAVPSLQGDLRPQIWSAAWQEWRKAPWLGQGFGREIAGESLRPLTPPGGGHPDVLHAHNVFINVALQLGVAGLAVFGAILVLLAREFTNALRDPESAPAAVLGLAVLTGFVVKNLTDDFMHRHNALVFWAVIALLLGLSRRRRAPA